MNQDLFHCCCHRHKDRYKSLNNQEDRQQAIKYGEQITIYKIILNNCTAILNQRSSGSYYILFSYIRMTSILWNKCFIESDKVKFSYWVVSKWVNPFFGSEKRPSPTAPKRTLRRAKKGIPKFFACGGLFSLWRHCKPLKNS